jgi:hypothetical protein
MFAGPKVLGLMHAARLKWMGMAIDDAVDAATAQGPRQ